MTSLFTFFAFRFLARLLIPVVCFGYTGRAAAQTSAPPDPAPQMTREALLAELNPRGGAALVKAWHADDPDAVAAFYTEDAVLIDARGTVYRGKAEIASGFLRTWVPAIRQITPTIERVVGGRDQMTLLGRYTAVVDRAGSTYDAEGVFSNTWVRQPDGSWKIRASLNSAPSPVSATPRPTRR